MKKILFAISLLFALSSFAQPANDNCSNAVQLALQSLNNPTYTNGNVGNATQSTVACSGNTSTDVWYSFTANSAGNYIKMPSQSGLDLAFEIFDACGGNSIACVDNNSINYSEGYYNNNFVIGQTYYIKVFLYNQSFANAPFQIAVIDIPAPANDDCVNAINLPLQPQLSVNYTSVNLGGATESTVACSGNSSTDAWFTFTANSVGNYFKMPSQSNLDVAFEILDACNGNSIACVDNYGRNYSEGYYNNNFVVGQTYTIKVFLSDQITHDANIEIAVIDIPQPVNDECANATTLNIMTDNSTLTNGNLGGATESISACSGTVANDVWFSFVANATELSIYTGAESQLDTVFEIYDACNGNSLVCVDDNGMNFSETVTYSNFTIGQTYYLRVFGKNALYYNKSFGIVVYNPNASITDTSNIDTNWQISPNPVNDVLFINCQNELLQTQVVISNLSGQILLNNSLISHRIDVADLPKGIYFIHLFSQGKDMGVNRFIVE
jgi:hypothetical protein